MYKILGVWCLRESFCPASTFVTADRDGPAIPQHFIHVPLYGIIKRQPLHKFDNMRSMILILLIVFSACGQNSSPKNSDKETDKYNGVFEYVYPGNTSELIENHFIVFATVDNKLKGYYYGTSDEFDEAREGYLPAFFVAKMDNLIISGDTIRFILKVDNSEFLTKAVDLKYVSTKDAIDAGYKNWENKIPTIPKEYIGLFKDEKTILFTEEQEFLNKTFQKKE
jgi:hypothetical protein